MWQLGLHVLACLLSSKMKRQLHGVRQSQQKESMAAFVTNHAALLLQAELRVAREKGRRRGALAAKQEAELQAAQAEVAAVRAAAESAQRIANAAADDKKRLKVQPTLSSLWRDSA